MMESVDTSALSARIEPAMASNQRSVIAKSVRNQIIRLEMNNPNHTYHGYMPAKPARANADQQFDRILCNNVNSLDNSMPSQCLPEADQFCTSSSASSSPHGTIFSLGNSHFDEYDEDSYGSYDFSKSKRKPIPVPTENKDNTYWERRRRNNESAKRSRAIRRLKELQTTKRILYLEHENVKLQTEVKFLREELKRLRENEFLPYLVRD